MAGASGDRNQSLKETIYESLSAILSPDHATRSNGEDQIKALEVTEGILEHRFLYCILCCCFFQTTCYCPNGLNYSFRQK